MEAKRYEMLLNDKLRDMDTSGTCTVPEEFQSMVNECNDFYTLEEQDKGKYTLSWQNITAAQASTSDSSSNNVLSRERRALRGRGTNKKLLKTLGVGYKDLESVEEVNKFLEEEVEVPDDNDDWMFSPMSKSDGFPYWGKYSIYDGGGFLANLGDAQNVAHVIASILEDSSWIDRYTRAVFFEFSVYNTNLNLFATSFIIIETLPTTLVVSTGGIHTFTLFRYHGQFAEVVMATEIFLLLILTYFFYVEVKKCWREGRRYLTKFWNLVELTIAIALFATIVLWVMRWWQGDKNIIRFHENPQSFIGFQFTAAADDAMIHALAFILFFSILKLIKFINIFPFVIILSNTIQKTFIPILEYSLPFVVAFFSFAFYAYLTFNSLEPFHSVFTTVRSQFMMILGGPILVHLRDQYPISGSMYFLIFTMLEIFWFLNIFIVIINEVLTEASMEISQYENDLAFYCFIRDTASEWFKSFVPAFFIPDEASISSTGTSACWNDGIAGNAQMRELLEEKEKEEETYKRILSEKEKLEASETKYEEIDSMLTRLISFSEAMYKLDQDKQQEMENIAYLNEIDTDQI